MEQNHLNTSQLGDILGQRQLGSEILKKTRELSKAHIVKLAQHFNVSPSVFFQVPG
jgi:antitoxin component HigA of HigAB toxin-antitoxin module